jgi:hypothetical protein
MNGTEQVSSSVLYEKFRVLTHRKREGGRHEIHERTQPGRRLSAFNAMNGEDVKLRTDGAIAQLLAAFDTGKSDAMKNYFRFMATFRNYSMGNQILIYTQKPTATLVKGFRGWNQYSRYVRKGEKGPDDPGPAGREGKNARERIGRTGRESNLWL